MSGVAEAVVGHSVVAELREQVKTLKRKNGTLKADKRRLKADKSRLKERNKALQKKNTQLGKRNKTLKGNLESARARLTKARAGFRKMDNTTRRIARRAIRGVGRNVAAVPLETIPVAGAATVVAVTALDVRQACATARDMQELRTASGIDDAPKDWTAQVCGVFTRPAVPEVCDMTIDECRDHASEVRADLGDDMGAQIDRQCDALNRPDPPICREPDPDDGPTTPLPEP
jgi:alanyl-tRNA synthetase